MKVTTIVIIVLVVVSTGLVYGQSMGDESNGTAMVKELIADNPDGTEYLLIDVRTEEEYESGYIPTAVNIDYRVIAEEMADVNRDMPIAVYCRSGARSRTAYMILRDMGFTNVTDIGGIIYWDGDIFIPQ